MVHRKRQGRHWRELRDRLRLLGQAPLQITLQILLFA